MKKKLILTVNGILAAAIACHIAIEDFNTHPSSETETPAISKKERKNQQSRDHAGDTQDE